MVSNYVKLSKKILQLHKTVSLAADIMFINGMVFPVSISRHVKVTMVHYIRKRMTGNIYKSLENINYVYYRHGIFL